MSLAAQVITLDKKGWFYHRALLFDVDSDGTMDIVTARATAPGKDQQVNSTAFAFLLLESPPRRGS